jgi:hypothetical protein
MKQTWKPTTAGILSIVCGAWGLIVGLVIALLGGSVAWMAGVPFFVPRLLAVIGVPMIVLGVVAIIGGIYAVKRRLWGLALAGAICALLVPPPFVLGVLAIIFVILGKDEFEQKQAE